MINTHQQRITAGSKIEKNRRSKKIWPINILNEETLLRILTKYLKYFSLYSTFKEQFEIELNQEI